MEGYRRSVQVVAGLLAGAIFLAACSDDDNRRRRSRDDDGGEGGESANPSGGTASGGVSGSAVVAGSAGTLGTSGSAGVSGSSSSSGGSDGSGGTTAGMSSSAGNGAAGSGTSGSDGAGGAGASAGTDGSGGTGATSGSSSAGGSSSGDGGTSGSGGSGPDLSELPEACALVTSCEDCCETVGVFSLDAESMDRTLEGVTQWSYDGGSVNANFTFTGPNQAGAIFFRLSAPADIEYLDLYAGGSGGDLEVVLVNDSGTNGCIYPVVNGTLIGYSSCWGTGAGPAFGVPVDQIDIRIFSTTSGPGYLEVLELGFSGAASEI